MAIDTAAKRLSMLNYGNGDLLPKPSGAVDAGERATLLELYSGIGLSPPPTPTAIAYRGGMRLGMWLGIGGLASGNFPG